MKRAIFWATALAFVAATNLARASDPAGVYARIDHVWLEPNEQTPERIKIWGAFALASGGGDFYRAPECGYLYFKIVPGQEKQCRAEWADFDRVAATGECVAFGNRYTARGNQFTIRTVPVNVTRATADDMKKITQWIADLDSDQFAVRDQAMHELEKRGESVHPALRQALKTNPKPEARQRLERLTESGRPDPYPLGVGVMKLGTGKNVDTDYPPIRGLLDLPAPAEPGDGSLNAVGKTTLVARNIRNSHHADARYVFEIEDAGGTKEVSPPIPAGEKQTKWSPRMELKAGSRYIWRVRAVQGDWKGPVTRAVFIVKG